MTEHDLAIRDMDEATYTMQACRLEASKFRQMGFDALADDLQRNARAAEKWLVKAARVYPKRCAHDLTPGGRDAARG